MLLQYYECQHNRGDSKVPPQGKLKPGQLLLVVRVSIQAGSAGTRLLAKCRCWLLLAVANHLQQLHCVLSHTALAWQTQPD
jgi:hypothetical protein